MTRTLIIFFVLTCVITGFSMLVLPSTGMRAVSISKAIFNSTHWTVIWTVLFVYSIQVSAFAVFFGQLFRRAVLAKVLGFVLWVITLIDFYSNVPVGLRYFLCLFPNTGLMFCLNVILQYERKSAGTTSYGQLYTNLFSYPLYIGLCLLMMLIYSVIYILLAIYVERVNPGEFGISQRWNYLCTKSYWRPESTATVTPLDMVSENVHSIFPSMHHHNRWIEKRGSEQNRKPLVMISHLSKSFGKVKAVIDLSMTFYQGEVYSLLGHNGAGKTTTTFILVGMLEPTSGSITIDGLDNRLHIEKVRKIMGFCPQYDILYNELSVKEHLELMAKMRHLDNTEIKESTTTILKLIGLIDDRDNLSKNLSGGMKRRLSIGISMVGNPKVLILDEPTSGIDPYNRRLIWTIIRKMKESGKCVILTTHFLEEADVLSDSISIMANGRLQATGTPDFLKSQTEFEYRLFIDKQDQCDSQVITKFIQDRSLPAVLERENAYELVYGIRRGESKQVSSLVDTLDQRKTDIGIAGYGLSTTNIEEVFLRLVQEEETMIDAVHNNHRKKLADKLFRTNYERITGVRLFWYRIWALLIKRWIILRRNYIFLIGFFIVPIIAEILIVATIPNPQQIQQSLFQNERIKDAQVSLTPSLYNPQTIVTYANNDQNLTYTRLINYLTSMGAVIDNISNDTVLDYVRNQYLQTELIFIQKYQMGFAAYNNLTSSVSSLAFNAYFSTVNYHTMPTSLAVAATNLFQFYANSDSKRITTTNQPILTTTTSQSFLALFLEVLYCFDSLPQSLFNFLNCVLVSIFASILMTNLIHERVGCSKNLQLLTNTPRRAYWIATTIFDSLLCLTICIILTVIVKIAAVAKTDELAEVYVYRNNEQAGYFFLMILMYSSAILPFIYVFSFYPDTELLGFIGFFLLNVIACFVDMVFSFIVVFTQGQTPSPAGGTTRTSLAMNVIRYILAVLFPSVNFKRALFDIRTKSSATCISAINTVMGTSWSYSEPWMSIREPGLGLSFMIFILQIVVWWLILVRIEYSRKQKQNCCACCCCCCHSDCIKSRKIFDERQFIWNDSHLDEDVRNERQQIKNEKQHSTSHVVIVNDLVRQFKKSKKKLVTGGPYTAVDHLNFRVPKQACFGLLGANGAGKTTTFRMLIDDIKPSSGDIIINGKNINETKRHLEIGFCPQADWLLDSLNVTETIALFARLRGLKGDDVKQICDDMITIFGLDLYEKRQIEKLSGGNKRKMSAAVSFIANPALVLLDEPTTGLDAGAKRKLWEVIRVARDVGLTIIMTSHSMEECEALCTKIGIMKTGRFECLGSLQRLKSRFGNGYSVRIKATANYIDELKSRLTSMFPNIEIESEYNEMLYCNIPIVSTVNSDIQASNNQSISLGRVFDILNAEKDMHRIETYSVTQTTLEQIFIRLAGEDNDESEPVKRTGNYS